MARVLVATPEPIAARMAGPAIRAAHIARVLGLRHDVTLVSLAGESISPIGDLPVRGPDVISPADFDAAVIQGKILVDHADLGESSIPLVVDWFDPFHLEALHRGGADNILRIDLIEGARSTIAAQAARGDFFLCSNQQQREHWLGWLSSAGRINRHNHDADPTLEALLAIAPFGLDRIIGQNESPTVSPLRDTFPQIGPDDPVLIWAGGLHDWLDPVTVVKAMPTVLDENPDTRLVFLAGPHPNTSIETMGVRGQAIAAATDLRLFGKHVMFVNQWVPYHQRLDWFAAATVGVIAHHDHLETRLSHRTRLLDHLAAGLPTVSSGGDPASGLLASADAAVLVPPGDAESFGKAIAALIRNDNELETMSRASRALAETMQWEQTVAPLVDWMEHPRPAADRSHGRAPDLLAAPSAGAATRLVGRAKLHWEDGGFKQVVDRTVAAGRRRIGR